jgi:hypothetical protein
MKKIFKIFFDATKELEWLSQQEGWKLVHTNGIQYIFVESDCNYNYEFVYFHKNRNEVSQIQEQIKDTDVEFVCHSSTWALFRKDAAKGEIHVLEDNYSNYKTLQRRYIIYVALGASYTGLATMQIALYTRFHGIYIALSVLFYFCSIMFYLSAIYYRKSAQIYDDGTYAQRMKNEKLSK